MYRVLTFCTYPLYMGFHYALSDTGVFVRTEDLSCVDFSLHYERIRRLMEDFRPDLVFTIGRPELHVNLEALAALCREKRIFHVYWATEDRTYHQKYSLPLAENFDFIFTIAEECTENYKALGKPSALLRYGCNPGIHRPVPPYPGYAADIAIAASYHQGMKGDFIKKFIIGQENDNEHQLRMQCIKEIVLPLVEAGYNIAVWGMGWEELLPDGIAKGFIPYEDLPALYNSAKIVLGLEWDDISETKTTGRPFEVMGCGAFYLTRRTKALTRLFEDRKHLVLSSGREETLSLADYYLAHEAERKEIAAAGRREVYSRHTCHQRARYFIETLRPYLREDD